MTTLRLAHRGDHRRLPENSLAALVAGARAPMSDGVEFDVRVSADGVPVVIHDATLERTHGLATAVTESTAAELARSWRCLAGRRHGRPATPAPSSTSS